MSTSSVHFEAPPSPSPPRGLEEEKLALELARTQEERDFLRSLTTTLRTQAAESEAQLAREVQAAVDAGKRALDAEAEVARLANALEAAREEAAEGQAQTRRQMGAVKEVLQGLAGAQEDSLVACLGGISTRLEAGEGAQRGLEALAAGIAELADWTEGDFESSHPTPLALSSPTTVGTLLAPLALLAGEARGLRGSQERLVADASIAAQQAKEAREAQAREAALRGEEARRWEAAARLLLQALLQSVAERDGARVQSDVLTATLTQTADILGLNFTPPTVTPLSLPPLPSALDPAAISTGTPDTLLTALGLVPPAPLAPTPTTFTSTVSRLVAEAREAHERVAALSAHATQQDSDLADLRTRNGVLAAQQEGTAKELAAAQAYTRALTGELERSRALVLRLEKELGEARAPRAPSTPLAPADLQTSRSQLRASRSDLLDLIQSLDASIAHASSRRRPDDP